jgi:membrane-associated progesterone receptor component
MNLIDLFTDPIHIVLILLGIRFLYKVFWPSPTIQGSSKVPSSASEQPPEEEFKDYTLKELRKFDGKEGSRIYIAVKAHVFDVTVSRHLYGPGTAIL